MGPQCEDGYTRIANELLDALTRYCPGNGDGQIFLAIIRRTYGWHKKEDAISIGQLEDMTGLSRRSVIYSLQNLESKRMITIRRRQGRGIKDQINEIALNKNYQTWLVQEKSLQYKKAIENRKLNYKNHKAELVQEKGLVQENDLTSARNALSLVQENAKNSRFLAPTKERKKTKENTKEKESLFELCKVWKAYIEMRAKIKKPMTTQAQMLAIKKLINLQSRGHPPIAVLEQSIFNSWQGLFEIKRDSNDDLDIRQAKADRIRESNRQAAREFVNDG